MDVLANLAFHAIITPDEILPSIVLRPGSNIDVHPVCLSLAVTAIWGLHRPRVPQIRVSWTRAMPKVQSHKTFLVEDENCFEFTEPILSSLLTLRSLGPSHGKPLV